VAHSAVDRLESLLASGRNTSLLRFSLGNEYLKTGEPRQAAMHLAAAVALDPQYSAAWKLLGKAQLANGEIDAARAAWQRGIEVADARGDQQAAREMRAFLRRLSRSA
jgi:Tfp pilus assembly protein PilF